MILTPVSQHKNPDFEILPAASKYKEPDFEILPVISKYRNPDFKVLPVASKHKGPDFKILPAAPKSGKLSEVIRSQQPGISAVSHSDALLDHWEYKEDMVVEQLRADRSCLQAHLRTARDLQHKSPHHPISNQLYPRTLWLRDSRRGRGGPQSVPLPNSPTGSSPAVRVQAAHAFLAHTSIASLT